MTAVQTEGPSDAPQQGTRRDGLAFWVRPFVYGFLALFVLCAVARYEWWPLTGWRLFSYVRAGTTTVSEVVTVDHAGAEHPIEFGRLPRGFEQYTRLMPRMAELSTAQRNRICAAWSAAAAQRGDDVTFIRIYRVTRPVPRRAGRLPAPSYRKVRWTCGLRP